MMRVYVDTETASTVDLGDAGAYAYAMHPSTRVLVAVLAVDDGEPVVWRWGAPPPPVPADAEWWAHHAAFDRVIYNEILVKRCGWPPVPLTAWRCTLAAARYHNLPGSLDGVAKALGVPLSKDHEGARLMRRLCKPDPKDPDHPWRHHTPQDIERLAAYSVQDVLVLREIATRLPPLPPTELAVWQLDQRINDRGVYLDDAFRARLERLAQQHRDELRAELQRVTHGAVESETKLAALRAFCEANGVRPPSGSLDSDAVEHLLRLTTLPPAVRRALEIRHELGKSSLAKLDRMRAARCPDGRLHGMLEYYGASQTGRWAGRIVQPQNLPRGMFEREAEYAAARTAVELADEAGDVGVLRAVYGARTSDALASLLRCCFAAAPEHMLVVADLSAIEARGLAWVSGESWRLEVFRTDGKIYEASAAKMLGVPKESIKKGSRERMCGKVAELALGYQGGVGALERFGAVTEYGIPAHQLPDIVRQWRAASPMVVQFWRAVERAAVEAVKDPGRTFGYRNCWFRYVPDRQLLKLKLPSGRVLFYHGVALRPRLRTDWLGDDEVGWELIYRSPDPPYQEDQLYGGKLTNNIVQGLCRDVLVNGMLNAERAGLPVILSVHDEVVCEVPRQMDPAAAVQTLVRALTTPPTWAADFPLAADGWAGTYYRK